MGLSVSAHPGDLSPPISLQSETPVTVGRKVTIQTFTVDSSFFIDFRSEFL